MAKKKPSLPITESENPALYNMMLGVLTAPITARKMAILHKTPLYTEENGKIIAIDPKTMKPMKRRTRKKLLDKKQDTPQS